MTQLMAIAAGGAVGSVLRFWISIGVQGSFGKAFPYGTLTVNVVGSLLIGLLFVVISGYEDISPQWRAVLMVGFLGALTTFSTFSLETLELIQRAEIGKALLNITLNVGVCLCATWLGVVLGKNL